MKRTLLTLTVLFSALLLGATDGRIIFVQAGNNGQGTSWQDAYGNLQDALLIAKSADQIWVAEGIYTPTQTNDRTISFIILDGVQLYGGFKGTEATLAERDLTKNTTILSGEIGKTETKDDNSYTIIHTKGVSNMTIVDGFTISDGMANALTQGGELNTSGAAWFNDARTQTSSPTIKNCIFTNNSARDGGAIYNHAEDGECLSSITACTFTANRADFDGGAIYNNGTYGICNVQISDCFFIKNNSNYGAGILNIASRGEIAIIIKNTLFVGNISTVRGAAVFCHKEKRSTCEAILDNCRFENNIQIIGNQTGGATEIPTEAENNASIEITITTTQKKS